MLRLNQARKLKVLGRTRLVVIINAPVLNEVAPAGRLQILVSKLWHLA